MISKEEYLENEEKIQKALTKSKEEREQRKQDELLGQGTNLTDAEKEFIKKADDEKHVLDAEKTETIKTNVGPRK